ncbi:MAG: hypothetical protein R3B84_04390 [Zavarzinella sp.]
MISVVLYGRNDSHGYNLHKRAAISLNSIAEVLTHPGDEILFVDYNTPSDMPVFPEAIADLLTDQCKSLLKIFRVRPEIHLSKYAQKTHLVALEPISRNIAVRRSNPSNRWILSTNTDMVFVPRDQSKSLSDVCATLAPGFYELPRFEMPEPLWESVDRKASNVRIFYDYGKQYHVSEVVHSNDVVMFDGPGDFQLVERKELFEIDGFDERMILGWHVDSNLCKRLQLKNPGYPKSLLNEVFAYHCCHTRQASLMHGNIRLQNDLGKFVDYLQETYLPDQRDTWGLPNEQFEEIILTPGYETRFHRMLGAIQTKNDAEYYEFTFRKETYNNMSYVPDHILPYVAEQLTTVDTRQDVVYVGNNKLMAQKLELAYPMLNPGRQCRSYRTSDLKLSECQPEKLLEKTPGILIIDFGFEKSRQDPDLYPNQLSQAQFQQLDELKEFFESFVAAERKLATKISQPRTKVIVINAIHCFIEHFVSEHLSFTHTPLSSRTRHGYVLPSPLSDFLPARQAKDRASNDYQKVVSSTVTDQEITDLISKYLLDHARSQLLAANSAVDNAAIAKHEAARARLEQLRYSQQVALPYESSLPEKSIPFSKLCSIHDWDNPLWSKPVRANNPNEVKMYFYDRHRLAWERIQISYVINQITKEFREPRLLCTSTSEESFCYHLGNKIHSVHNCYMLEQGHHRESMFPKELTRLELFTDDLSKIQYQPGGYDIFLQLGNISFTHGPKTLTESLQIAQQQLSIGGYLMIAAEVVLQSEQPMSWFSYKTLNHSQFAVKLEQLSGFTLQQPHFTIDRETVDRVQFWNGEPKPHTTIVEKDHVRTSAVLVLKKTRECVVQDTTPLIFPPHPLKKKFIKPILKKLLGR